MFLSGWTESPNQRVYMLTVTAPGDRWHALPSGDVCRCTPEGGVSLPAFNATAGRGFSKLLVYMRRRYGDVQYGKAAECQERGALHFHVLMRVEKWRALERDFRQNDPFCELRSLVERCGFGHEIDLGLAGSQQATYWAKYVSKTAADRDSMPWLDFRTGEVTRANRYRPWSASRRWGSTMKPIKQAQAAWAIAKASPLRGADATEAGTPAGAIGAGPLDHNTASSTGSTIETGVIEWKAATL